MLGNVQFRGVGQGPNVLAIDASNGCVNIFICSSINFLFFLPLSGHGPK